MGHPAHKKPRLVRSLGLILIGIAFHGCMNEPLPPERATLSARFLLTDSEDSEGIEVLLPGTAYRGVTDREGHIRFDDLPPREYEILVKADGYQDYRESNITLEPGDHLFLGEITLAPRQTDGEIHGTVKVEGEESPEVNVILLGSDRTVVSATDGKYHFEHVPVGNYQVTFYYPGAIAQDPIDVTVEAGAQTALSEVVLRKIGRSAVSETGAIRGRVALAGDADFSGVTVLLPEAGLFVKTDPEGGYWIDKVQAGRHDLVFEKEGYGRQTIAGVRVASGTITEVTSVILFKKQGSPKKPTTVRKTRSPETPVDPSEPGIVAGYAFYPDGTDHRGIVIRLLDPPMETVTDEKGSYLLEGVPPGLRTLRAEADGYQMDQLVNLEVRPGEVLRAPEMQLSYGPVSTVQYTSARLYGQVVDADGEPLSGVMVAVERTSLNAVTGRDGTFLIEEVPLGEYSVLFSAEGFEEQVASVIVEGFDDVPIPVVTLMPIEEYLEIIHTIPRDGERKVEVSDRVHIELQFSENLSKKTVRQNIRVFPPVASRIEMVESDTVVIDLLRRKGDGVAFYTEYTVLVDTGLESTQNHRLEEPYELTFKTGGPRVLGSIPESGAKDVILAIDEPVILQFNTPVNIKDLKKITVRPNTGEIYNFVPQHVPYGHRVEMQMQLQPNRTYQITIPRSVRTQDGDRFENTPYRIKFKSGSYDDLTDPALTEEFLGESGDPFDR